MMLCRSYTALPCKSGWCKIIGQHCKRTCCTFLQDWWKVFRNCKGKLTLKCLTDKRMNATTTMKILQSSQGPDFKTTKISKNYLEMAHTVKNKTKTDVGWFTFWFSKVKVGSSWLRFIHYAHYVQTYCYLFLSLMILGWNVTSMQKPGFYSQGNKHIK